MSETKFTPGPWYIGIDDDDGTPFIEICKGECPSKEYKDIAKVNSTLDTNTDEFVITDEDRANASLIAAAPELYEELTQAEKALSGIWKLDRERFERRLGDALDLPDTPILIKRLRAVIAKASGESWQS